MYLLSLVCMPGQEFKNAILQFLYIYISGLPLRLSPLTEDTSKITVSSCGVKLQEVLSGFEKKAKALGIHMHFCGVSQQFFFVSTWGVIFCVKLF